MTTWELRLAYEELRERSERELLNFYERAYLARLQRELRRAVMADKLRARASRQRARRYRAVGL